jgi:hypothetical protein
MDLRWGIRMSFSDVKKPHTKNSVVTIAIALLFVPPGDAMVLIEDLFTFVMAIRGSGFGSLLIING